MKHSLSLEVPDTYNDEILRIIDTSLYAEDLPVTCGLLQITSPGFSVPVQIELSENFNLVLNACTLGIQLTDCLSELQPIPDGIYTIKYTVAPADLVYVEYKHMRVTQILNDYHKALGKIELKGCDPEDCVKDQLKELRLIKSFIDVAKAKVEYHHDCHEGMELLKYAQKKLKTFKGTCS